MTIYVLFNRHGDGRIVGAVTDLEVAQRWQNQERVPGAYRQMVEIELDAPVVEGKDS